jgi:hypothetical protein
VTLVAAAGVPAGRSKRRPSGPYDRGMGASDPGLFALKGALRAAIVVPVAFALSLEAIGSEQMALFAAFGSMALLVFVDFGGALRTRIRAYLLLLVAGAGLIALGTACSQSTVAATVAMAVVAFVILFAGVLNGYVAAAHAGAMLTFVLPVMIPARLNELGMRLAGWGLAGALSIAAIALLWPGRPRGALREQAARALRALAALLQAHALAESSRAPEPVGVEVATGEDAGTGANAEAREQSTDLRRRFLALEHRPGGTASRVAALARLVDDIGWLNGLAQRADPVPALASGDGTGQPFGAERAGIEAAVPEAMQALAARLDLGEREDTGQAGLVARAALARVARAYEALGHALLKHAAGWREQHDETVATRELDEAFQLRQLTFAVLRTGRDALLACGEAATDDPLATRRARIDAAGRLARAHTSMRSVWFRNSLRGSAGLALAVLVGQLSDLQHSFWIVLGTMSVLRSNALATGATIAQALLGTFVGIIAGGLLLELVGDSHIALWAVLPFAVALAAYAPRAISFAAGQGAFSLVVLILFNLLAPAGWRVGLVRVEDVAIGAGVSLLAGALIWPRGATAVLREAFGTAYARAAAYLGVTIDTLLEGGAGAGANMSVEAGEAADAAQLLEATVRDYLSERSSARGSLDDLTTLIAGATRARRVAGLLQSAHAFARLAPIDDDLERLARARDTFAAERHELCDWYAELGTAVAGGEAAPEPALLDGADGTVGEAAGIAVAGVTGGGDGGQAAATVVLERPAGAEGLPPGLAIAWAHRHLVRLAELEPALAQACEDLASRG